METESLRECHLEVKNLLNLKSGWTEVPKGGPTPRVGHCCLFVQKASPDIFPEGIFIIGGADHIQSFNHVDVFEHNTAIWSKLLVRPFRPRYEHSAFLSKSNPDKIFVFGGADESGNKDDIQCLESSEFGWRDVHPDGVPPAPRTFHNGICVDDKFFVFGGGGLGLSAVDDDEVHLYDIKNNRWETPTTCGLRPSRRLGHMMVAVGKKVYIHGGLDGLEMFDDLHVFDIETLSWTPLEVKGEKPRPRASHCGIAHKNSIFIMGGLVGCKETDEVFQLDIEKRSWIKRPDMTLPRASLDFAACTFQHETALSGDQPHGTDFASPTNTFVLIHGGMTAEGDIFNDCYIAPLVEA